MNKKNFKNLLIDLYNIYNPANIQYVDDLVQKNSRFEFDALKNIFIKYNRKDMPYYDEHVGTDEYIIKLIKEYEGGLRSLEGVVLNTDLTKNPEEKKEEKIFQEIENSQKEIKEDFNERTKQLEDLFLEKEKSIKEYLENKYKEFEMGIKSLSQTNDTDIKPTIRIFDKDLNLELDLQNKHIIASMGKGARLIIKDKNNKVIGMEIFDIIYDGTSELNESPLIEVFLRKG